MLHRYINLRGKKYRPLFKNDQIPPPNRPRSRADVIRRTIMRCQLRRNDQSSYLNDTVHSTDQSWKSALSQWPGPGYCKVRVFFCNDEKNCLVIGLCRLRARYFSYYFFGPSCKARDPLNKSILRNPRVIDATWF